jgi:hypothetical protein
MFLGMRSSEISEGRALPMLGFHLLKMVTYDVQHTGRWDEVTEETGFPFALPPQCLDNRNEQKSLQSSTGGLFNAHWRWNPEKHRSGFPG